MLDELSVPNPGVSRPASIIRSLMQSNAIPEGPGKSIFYLLVNHRLTSVVSSPETNLRFPFDINATPNSVDLSSLFDTFAQDVQTQAMGELSNIDTSLMNNTMNDSLFGFMDNTYCSEAFGWK
jgi:hypothetical protein